MEIEKVKRVLSESKLDVQADVEKMIESIIYSDELNMNYNQWPETTESLALGVKVYEAMINGVGEEQAFSLLEAYDEARERVRDIEKKYWVKNGIRLGFAFQQIINGKRGQN